MSKRNIMLAFLSLLVSSFSFAESDDSLYGTHTVYFEPVQSRGVLQSCSLVYNAVHSDFAYKKGAAILVVGNISVYQRDENLIIGLKIGTKDLNSKKSDFIRPHYAYLQSKSESTAKSKSLSMEGEDGFRLMSIQFNDSTSKLIADMLESGNILIGFNRTPNEIDVLVPLDLRVASSEYSDTGVIRKRSDNAILGFLDCYQKILEQSLSKTDK